MNSKCRIVLTKKAFADLRRLERKVAGRVLLKLDFFEKSGDPLSFAKRVRDRSLGDYRFRVGNYRVLFDRLSGGRVVVLSVVAIRHRREVYL